MMTPPGEKTSGKKKNKKRKKELKKPEIENRWKNKFVWKEDSKKKKKPWSLKSKFGFWRLNIYSDDISSNDLFFQTYKDCSGTLLEPNLFLLGSMTW